MPDLENHMLLLTVVAFCLWLGLLATCRVVGAPLAGIIAAVMSWAGVALSLTWVVDLLRRARLWPDVHFEFDRYAIRRDQTTVLEQNATGLKANPRARLLYRVTAVEPRARGITGDGRITVATTIPDSKVRAATTWIAGAIPTASATRPESSAPTA